MDYPHEVTITIPAPIANKIKEHIKETAFDSVSSYVTYILRQVLAKMELAKESKEKQYTPEQKNEIEKNLKAMGYL